MRGHRRGAVTQHRSHVAQTDPVMQHRGRSRMAQDMGTLMRVVDTGAPVRRRREAFDGDAVDGSERRGLRQEQRARRHRRPRTLYIGDDRIADLLTERE